MIHEDFVTYDQAVKLKELGFDWKCYTFYHWDNWCGLSHSGICENHNMFEKCISAPTLTQAQKWLREKGIDLDITLYRVINALKDVPTIKRYYNCEIAFGEDDENLCEDFDTYEQALSAGIDEALEILTH